MALYQVKVKVPWGDDIHLGDALDPKSLLDCLYDCLKDAAEAEPEDDEDSSMRVAEVYGPTEEEPDVIAVMCETGTAGVASTIADQVGTELFRRQLDHIEFQRALAVLKLPPTRKKGLLVTHSPNNLIMCRPAVFTPPGS